MDVRDEEVIQKLLTLIERDECEAALKYWSNYRKQVGTTCDHCTYKDIDKNDDCCMCLESKLRTISLYRHCQGEFDNSLLYAARRLDQFHQKSILERGGKEVEIPQNKTRVLVVDDEKIVRMAIRVSLETHGYEVNEACDGEEGILLQNSTPFDIAIVDMMMPKKGGLDTIKELRSEFPELGILAISGNNLSDSINHLDLAKIYGASAALRKPFEGSDLIEAINEVASVAI